MTPYKKDSEIVKEFDEKERTVWQFSGPHEIYKEHTREMVKSFLLQTRHDDLRAIEEKIEGMKKKIPMQEGKWTLIDESNYGFNKALSDLLAFIKELRKSHELLS